MTSAGVCSPAGGVLPGSFRHGPCNVVIVPGAATSEQPGRKDPAVQETSNEQAAAPEKTRMSIPARAGAIGKAFLVYLGTGSVGVAIVAFIIFKMMGC